MRMTPSLIFDEPRLATKQAVAHELDLAIAFGKASQYLEQCDQRALFHRSTIAHRLAQNLQREDQPYRPAPRSERQPDHQARQRQPNSPQPCTARLPHPMAFGWRSVQIGALREPVTTAYSAPPPLAKACHGSVMQGHFKVQSPDATACRTQPNAQLRLLASDQVIAESTHGLERVCPHHRVTATGTHLAGRPLPLSIAEPVVNRLFGVTFASPPTHDTDVC